MNLVKIVLVISLLMLMSGCDAADDLEDIKKLSEIRMLENNKSMYAMGARDVYLSIGLPMDSAMEAAETMTSRAFGETE